VSKLLYICERGEFNKVRISQRPYNLVKLFHSIGYEVETLSSKDYEYANHKNIDSSHKKDFITPLTQHKTGIFRALNSLHFSIQSRKYISDKYSIIIFSQPDPMSNLGMLFIRKPGNTEYFLDVRDDWPKTLRNFTEKSPFLHLYIYFLVFIQKLIRLKIDKAITALPNFNYFDKPTFHIPTLVNQHSFVQKKFKSDAEIKIAYVGGFSLQSGITKIIKLVDATIQRLENRKVQFHFFGNGTLEEMVAEWASTQQCVFLHSRLESEELAKQTQDISIGLSAFNNWDVYSTGLNSNRLSFYIEINAMPFVLSEHKFEPALEGLFPIVSKQTPEAEAIELLQLIDNVKNEPLKYDKIMKKLVRARSLNSFKKPTKQFFGRGT
jgi:hypothetical protein